MLQSRGIVAIVGFLNITIYLPKKRFYILYLDRRFLLWIAPNLVLNVQLQQFSKF